MRFTNAVIAVVGVGALLMQASACGSGDTIYPCDNGRLSLGCTVGRCTVRSNANPLPDGAALTITEIPVTDDLQGDAIGPSLCQLALPTGAAPVGGLTLSLAVDTPPDAQAILFSHIDDFESSAVATSEPSGSAVVGVVGAPGVYGATERPANWSIQGYAGRDLLASNDQPSLLRNLSSQRFTSAFYDGTHLFVGNGPRVLIYNGIPNDPSVLPNVVLGQPDLNTLQTGTSSSLMGNSAAMGIWSDGTRLVVTSITRVLIWNQIPTTSFTPADIVLGQSDFSGSTANNGGVSAQSLAYATAVDSDGTRLLVADTLNHRVLQWNAFPTLVGQGADVVIGQPDFHTNTIGDGAIALYQPWGVALTSTGVFIDGQFEPGIVHAPPPTSNNPIADFVALPTYFKVSPTTMYTPATTVRLGNGLAVREADSLQRVAVMKAVPTGPATIDFVLGEPDLTRAVTSQTSASVVQTASSEEGLGGGKMLLVTDQDRLLLYENTPSYNFEPASRVIGQAGFSTNGVVDYRAISALSVANPSDVAMGGGMLAVADRGNNRVLLYKQSDLTSNNFSASIVVGQPDMASYVPNFDQKTPSAARLSGPSGVALDGTHLIVADSENHRVLIWNSVPTANGTPADVVLGQVDFASRRPNSGRGDANNDGFSDAGADGFFYPTGVTSDGTHLFVADRLNNRVLGWSTFPTSNGKAADVVIGQADFVTSTANAAGGPFAIAPNGLNLPTGVTLQGTTLWVADTENNRVVRWDNVTTAPTAGAFIGQASGNVVSNPNYQQPADTNTGFPQTQPTSTNTMLRPRGVAIASGRMFVSEGDSNRVHMFDAATFAPLGELGQNVDTIGTPDTSGVTAATLSNPLGVATDGTSLWVADAANHRVLGYGASGLTTGAAAQSVIGQPSTLTSGFNQSSSAAVSVTSSPRGLALQNGNLYVADTNNNRVLVMKTPVASGDVPQFVYGQPDDALNLVNSGAGASVHTLNAPRGVFADGNHVIISDTGNNRVLIFDATATTNDATLVLGQASFSTATPNGGGASLATLQQPTAAFTDGTSLFVADTGNHRVLVWKAFPTTNGQAADFVLGQSSPAGILSNGGQAAASAQSMSFPAAIEVINGTLFVADSGNNRILTFSSLPQTSGAAADGVLGQTDLNSRTASASASDLTHLAGPVAFAFDGANLYVTDRDEARVVVYSKVALTSGSVAVDAFGVSGGLFMKSPGGVVAERTAFFTSRVYIADTADNQLTVLSSVNRLGSN